MMLCSRFRQVYGYQRVAASLDMDRVEWTGAFDANSPTHFRNLAFRETIMTTRHSQRRSRLLAFVAASLFAQPAVVYGQVSDSYLPTWLAKRVRELQPQPSEKRLDEIAWADDIRHALTLAKEHQRPVMVFSLDGRINLGRC